MTRYLKTFIAASALAFTSIQAGTTVDTFTEGEILLGVYASGGVGATQNLMANLGSFENFDNADGQTTALLGGSLVADLVATYGASWNSRTDLIWTITGATFATSVKGLTRNTIFAASPRESVGDSPIEIASGSDGTLAGIRGPIASIAGYYDILPTTNNSTVTVIGDGAYTDSINARQNATASPQFGAGNTKAATGTSILDLYGLVPTSLGTAPNGAATDADGVVFKRGTNYLGYFTLNSNGLSFTATGSGVVLTPSTITFNPLPNKVFGDTPFTLSATASSGLAVTFAIVSGPATLSGSSVTLTGTGTVRIRASQAGNATYAAAANVDQSFTVAAPVAPSFSTQPVAQTATVGDSVTFTATVTGVPTPTLQWFKGSSPLSGQTSASLTLSNVQLADSGSYKLVATNPSAPSGVASSTASLTVNPAPVAPAFTTQPVTQTVTEGDTVTFTAVVTGVPAPALQWFKGSSPLSGQTSASLSLTNVQLADAGAYKLIATNVAAPSGVASSVASLTVNPLFTAPVFTVQPQPKSVNVGGTITFTATVTGNPTPTLQWFKGSSPVSGETSTSLTLANVQLADAGAYKLVATNSVAPSGIASDSVTLAVTEVAVAPAFTTQPSSQTITAGNSVTFTAAVTGTPTPSLQWFKGSSPLSGQTSASLSLANVQPADAGAYKLVATNSAAPSGVASDSATLTVNTLPTFTTQPSAQSITAGAPVTFTAVVTGSPTPTLQWFKGSSPLSGQTSASLTLSNVQPTDAGSYKLVATNAAAPSGIDSDAATLTVNTLPAFTTQPSAQSAIAGGSVTFTAAVTGTPTPTLQWFKGDTALSGQTASTLTLNNVQPDDAGVYKVVATNSAAPSGVASSTASLTVNTTPAFTTQPVSQTAVIGTNITFTAAVTGTPTPTLQWFKGDTALSGRTSATLTLSNVQATDAGDYKVVASSVATPSGVASDTVSLVVGSLPAFTRQPSAQSVTAGMRVSFTVTVTGSPAPTLQWFKGDTRLEGETGTTLRISESQVSDSGIYRVVASNVVAPEGVSSSRVNLTVAARQETAPSFPIPPTSVTANYGDSVTLTGIAGGYPAPTYVWRKGNTILTGQNGTNLVFNPVKLTDAGTYTITGYNSVAPNGVTAPAATLTVIVPAPAATGYPATLKAGSVANLDLTGGRAIPAGLVYKATGLPAGLVLNSATGRITGTVTAKPGSAKINAWAEVGSVKSTTRFINLTIGAFPAALLGAYEAVLDSGAPDFLPMGKLAVNVATGGTFTGQLVTGDSPACSLKGSLTLSSGDTRAGAELTLTLGANLPARSLSFNLGTSPGLAATLRTGTTTLGTANTGARITTTPPSGAIGVYTLTLSDPVNLGAQAPLPLGTGWATATISAKGVLTLSGKTADDTKLSATLNLGSDRAYRLYVNPYAKLATSYLAGTLPLTARTDSATRWHVAAGEASEVIWRKAPGGTGANYPDGFGPLALSTRLEPWVKPTATTPLTSLLGLPASGQTAGRLNLLLVAPGLANIPDHTFGSTLPNTLKLDAQNLFSVVSDNYPANPTGFNAKVNLTTGALTGGFTVPAIPPVAARKVTYTGVMLQPDAADRSGLIGGGFFLLPATSTGGPLVSGTVEFNATAP